MTERPIEPSEQCKDCLYATGWKKQGIETRARCLSPELLRRNIKRQVVENSKPLEGCGGVKFVKPEP